jgi:Xaa-Pro aminopeptidase
MMKLTEIQKAIRDEGLDGWLFFDHHLRDPLAYRVLGLTPKGIMSRRWYYFIPAMGDPRGLVHRIESSVLDALPGEKVAYSGWEQQKGGLVELLDGAARIAMQYSPECAVPYVSMVDGGTIELVQACGVEVASSANLIQYFEARWNRDQLDSHLEAGKLVDEIRRSAFRLIGDRVRNNQAVTEWEVQAFIAEQFRTNGLYADHGPNVSVNVNASNPHYEPQQDSSAAIKSGDTVLIDLWAKFDRPNAVYYDITWMGYCGSEVPSKLQNVFDVVREARDRAIRRVQETIAAGKPLCGYDVDDAARGYIREQGYGEYFFHRTGHSIGTEVHGSGANMDNLETHDERRIIPWTCFSVEPGIYLPEFGVRSEVNVFVDDGSARVTGEIQRAIVLA